MINIISEPTHRALVGKADLKVLLARYLILVAGITLWVISPRLLAFSDNTQQSPAELTLSMAVAEALHNDPWLVGNHHTQSAVNAQRNFAGSLPDPVVSLSLANLPTDSFDLRQEPMTQVKLGVSQMFPQGDTRALTQKQLEQKAQLFPFLRQDHSAKVALMVSELWLEAFKAQQSIALIESNRSLFEQLADVAQASYSSTVGKTRQQDIIRAQLELTRLDDRLVQLKQRQEIHWQKLDEWLSRQFVSEYPQGESNEVASAKPMFASDYQLSRQLPQMQLLNPAMADNQWQPSHQVLTQLFAQHPAVLAVEKKIRASEVGVELAEQKYKPNWGVNASYAYRDEDLLGKSRADFFSIGVSFELPIFTGNRQDQQVAAAIAETASVKTEKWQVLRNMLANFAASRAKYFQIEQRHQLYQQQLIPQLHQQAEASLTAYTNYDGDFAEVVRARIAELNGQIDALDIAVERQKTIVQLNYFMLQGDVLSLVQNRPSGE